MTRIAIIGGGISGLTAAYELELARQRGAPVDWHLYEASDRLGGIVETTRIPTPDGDFILEGGPDGWVSEKPWARELAIELGLEDQLISSNDATRKTYVLRDGQLLAIPDRMRLMVPEDLAALDASLLFSLKAKADYASELIRDEELQQQAPDEDESVASFVRRHFGDEVLGTLAAPLLSGVFGGDVERLSVRAVMPQFVAMEREHGSLIAGLQAARRKRGERRDQPIFTSLRRGMQSLTEALIGTLPADRLRLRQKAQSLFPAPERGWILRTPGAGGTTCEWSLQRFDELLLATSADATRMLLRPIHPAAADLVPTEASSAILAAFAWPAAGAVTIPQGFGFLVPPGGDRGQLLACTFVDQKFPHRAPAGARVLRAFFGGDAASRLAESSDDQVAAAALKQLREVLGDLPEPAHTSVRRWPRSLPQYEVGHLDRMQRLGELIAGVPGLHLLGNSYRGVGLPDLIRDARAVAASIAESVKV